MALPFILLSFSTTDLYQLSICQSYVMMHGLAIVQRYNMLCDDDDSW
jgi:hypothetical protein